MKLELPLPPSANRQYRRTRSGGVYLAPRVRAFRQEVWALVKQQRRRPIDGPIRMRVEIHPASARVIDLDNRVKQLLDALQIAGAFVNDSQINDLHLIKCDPDPPLGRCVVDIFEVR